MAEIVITCPKFMPEFTARECEDLGYSVQQIFPAGIKIDGNLSDVVNLNLHLRTAHRVLFPLKTFSARTPDDLYRETTAIAWEEYIRPDGYFSVVSSIDTESISNTQYANVRLKDAVVDRFRQKYNVRPDSGNSPDKVVVFLYWHGSKCIVYLDTSGIPLGKRGYRTMPHLAPLSEVLAAGIIQATQWDKKTPFVNPMCGSGTLTVEAAMISRNIPAQWHRKNFSFMHLNFYDRDIHREIRDTAKSKILHLDEAPPIIACDYDSLAIEATKHNISNARVGRQISVHYCDFRDIPLPDGEATIVLNAEYGERLGEIENLREVYSLIGTWFKHRGGGKMGYVFTGSKELSKHIGLRPSAKTPFMNGGIECRLLEYQLYDGSRKSKRESPAEQPL